MLLYTALIIRMLGIAAREKSAFERSRVAGVAMLLATPFWMAALGGVRAVPLAGAATLFGAHGGAKLLASAVAVGIVAATSHRRAESDRLESAENSLHGDRNGGIRIR